MQEIAELILNYMGGLKRIALYTGARKFEEIENGIQFRFENCTTTKVNFFKCVYDESADLFNVEFGYFDKQNKYNVVEKTEDVYCDMLLDMFEETTQMLLYGFPGDDKKPVRFG